MTIENKNAGVPVTNRIPWLKLKGFLDWLLNPKLWPRKDATSRNEAFRRWRSIRKVRLQLKELRNSFRDHNVRKATLLLWKAEKMYTTAKNSRYYKTPSSRIGGAPTAGGNVEFQKRIFLAALIFKMLRTSPVYRRRLAPNRDAFRNMTEYMNRQGFGPNIYETAKQAYYRYLLLRIGLMPT